MKTHDSVCLKHFYNFLHLPISQSLLKSSHIHNDGKRIYFIGKTPMSSNGVWFSNLLVSVLCLRGPPLVPKHLPALSISARFLGACTAVTWPQGSCSPRRALAELLPGATQAHMGGLWLTRRWRRRPRRSESAGWAAPLCTPGFQASNRWPRPCLSGVQPPLAPELQSLWASGIPPGPSAPCSLLQASLEPKLLWRTEAFAGSPIPS